MMEFIRHWLKGHKLTKCKKCESELWVEIKRSKNFVCSKHK